MSKRKLTTIWHFHKPDEIIAPSISELYDKAPNLAKKIIYKDVVKGRKKSNYLIERKRIENILYLRAKNLCKIETRYPVYTIIPILTNVRPSIFKDSPVTIIQIEDVLKYSTCCIGDSFRVFGLPRKNLYYPDTYTLLDLINMDKIKMQKQLSTFGKGAYIEVQIWMKRSKLIKLCK